MSSAPDIEAMEPALRLTRLADCVYRQGEGRGINDSPHWQVTRVAGDMQLCKRKANLTILQRGQGILVKIVLLGSLIVLP